MDTAIEVWKHRTLWIGVLYAISIVAVLAVVPRLH
jgi:anti-sigma-K factor RskA